MLAEHRTGQFVRLTRNPNYWAGAPKIDEVVFRVFKNADTMVQALQARARSTSPTTSTPTSVQLAEERPGHHHRTRPSTPASTSSPSTPARPLTATASRSATATRPSRTSGSARRSNYAIDRKTLVCQGARRLRRRRRRRSSRRSTRTAALQPGRHDPTPSTRPRPTRSWTARLQAQGERRDPGRPRDGQAADASGCSPRTRVAARRRSRCQYIQGWLKDIGIATRRSRWSSEDKPHRDHRRGRVRHVRVGLGGRARPGLPAVDVHLRPALATRTAARSTPALSDSFYCNPAYDALYQQQADDHRPGAAGRDRQADAEDALRRRAVRRDLLLRRHSRPTAATGSPGSSRSPTPDGVLLFQYGTYSYREHPRRPRPRRAASRREQRAVHGRPWSRSAPSPSLVVAGSASWWHGAGGVDDRTTGSSAEAAGDACRAQSRRPWSSPRGPPHAGGCALRRAPHAGRARHPGLRHGRSTSSCSGCCPATRSRPDTRGRNVPAAADRQAARAQLGQARSASSSCTYVPQPVQQRPVNSASSAGRSGT